MENDVPEQESREKAVTDSSAPSDPAVLAEVVEEAREQVLSLSPNDQDKLIKQLTESVTEQQLLRSEVTRLTAELDVVRRELAFLSAYHPHPDYKLQGDVLFLLRRLEPMAAPGFRKTRVGGANDGGYVMLDDFVGVDAAYSFGIARDVSWDREVANHGLRVFQYDHTIDALPEMHELFHWRKCGVGSKDDLSVPLVTLSTAIEQNGYSNSHDLIMKCDIEGAEWDFLGNAATDCLARFRQIVIEFHFLESMVYPERYHKMLTAISALTVSHRPVHVHGNNWAPIAVVANVPIPSVLEVTFVRKSGKTFVKSDEVFPTALDAPNNPENGDHYLSSFRF